MPSDHAGAESGSHGLSSSLRRNIEALRERRNQKTISASPEERLANAITAFTGSMRFVYLHLAIYGSWIIWNLIPGLAHFDPTFVILAMAASVEAIFLSTFVLISQNRAMAITNKRDDLDLHMKRTPAHRPIIATFWRSGPTSVMWGNLRALRMACSARHERLSSLEPCVRVGTRARALTNLNAFRCRRMGVRLLSDQDDYSKQVSALERQSR
jgi:hypothetical protein